ncbi:WD40/YVTN/BNR-like repeat-containing protein [Horticoccus sp. 23ND18S-11]|uniref:WD40/YVTN/BNR-like repeat-containing protein n=1 Tax=Horticoccus sp. 23ND18S-11 TaxID=3391832 RepID=UPI0039C8D744
MTPHRFSVLLSAILTTASLAAAAPAYDFFVCANINRNYVIGSKIITTNGVYQRDAAGAWQHIGYNDTGITAVAFDPRDRNVIYTSALNGLWRSLDGGKLWRICNDWSMTEARDVVVDPNAPDHVYLALPDGVAVSTDRAETIARRENGLPARGKYTQVLQVDRTRAGRVFAGCEVGIFLTEDGAQHWRRVLPTKDTVYDIQQSPHDPRIWMAATHGAGAWRSIDGGLTWEKVATAPATNPLYNVTFDVTNPQRLALGSWALGVLTSEDGGATWIDRNAGLPAAHHVWRVGVDPAGLLYASVAAETLFVSADFGRTWKPDALAGSLINKFLILPVSAK